MKIKLIALVCLAAALALSACEGGTDGTVSEEESSVLIMQEESNPYVYIDNSELEIADGGRFSISDFSIVLPESFVRQPVDDLALYASDSKKSTVVLNVESFYDMYKANLDTNITPCEYAKQVIRAQEGLQTPVNDYGDYAYFEYVLDMEQDQYRYFAYAYKGKNAFYLLQFCCNEVDAEQLRPVYEELEATVEILK